MSKGRTVTVRIPGDVCGVLAKNRQQGRGYLALFRAKDDFKGRARLMWRQLGEEPLTGKVRLTFTIFRGRALDPDGATWAMAPLIDGLKGEAFGDDDAVGVELGGVRFVTGKAWAGPMSVTEVRIEALDGG